MSRHLLLVIVLGVTLASAAAAVLDRPSPRVGEVQRALPTDTDAAYRAARLRGQCECGCDADGQCDCDHCASRRARHTVPPTPIGRP